MFFREEYYLKKIWSIRLYFHERFGTDLSVNGYHMPLKWKQWSRYFDIQKPTKLS